MGLDGTHVPGCADIQRSYRRDFRLAGLKKSESEIKPLAKLLATVPQTGRVEWLGVRPERGAPMRVVKTVEVDPEHGLSGDRYSGRSGARHATLIQAEHLPVIASCTGLKSVSPELLRRNIVVSGINLLALRDKVVSVGEVEMEVTGLCHPCSRMEQLLGSGGYNAVRGHGGITARILNSGRIALQDVVRVR